MTGAETLEQVREALGRHTTTVVAWNGEDALRRYAYGEQADESYRQVRDPDDREALAALDGCILLTAEEAERVQDAGKQMAILLNRALPEYHGMVRNGLVLRDDAQQEWREALALLGADDA